jgi:predicted O-methyltransferase YrrM
MTDERWAAVDTYFNDVMTGEDEALRAARRASDAAGLPPIAVSPPQGKLLHLLARAIGATRVLEIGTLAGYSTIWLGRALPPGGRLVTLEAEPRHAEVARDNIARAGLSETVDIRIGPALESLPKLAAERPEPFDLFFVDADKENNAAYFDWAVRLARPGSVIVVDNVVREGRILEPESPDPEVSGTRRFAERVGAERRASATTVQTVGSKGWDGFTLAVVTDS